MPKLNKAFTLELTPEQFLKQCSVTELHEIEMLMQSNWVKERMKMQEHINPAFLGVNKNDPRYSTVVRRNGSDPSVE